MKLKLTFIALIISAFVVSTATAEVPVAVGVKGGLSLSNFDFTYANPDFEYEPDRGIGVNVSLQAERPLNRLISLRVDAGFLQKGFDDEVQVVEGDDVVVGNRDIKPRVNYASVALLLKAELPTMTYLIGGPRVDIKLSVSDDDLDLIPADLEDEFKSSVFGFTLGAGQEFQVRKLFRVFIEAQYQHDLTPLYEFPEPPMEENGELTEIENRSFIFMVGFRRALVI